MATTAARVALRGAYIGALSDELKNASDENICEIHTRATAKLVLNDQVQQVPLIKHTLSKQLKLGRRSYPMINMVAACDADPQSDCTVKRKIKATDCNTDSKYLCVNLMCFIAKKMV